jgi:hypothetical protein
LGAKKINEADGLEQQQTKLRENGAGFVRLEISAVAVA